MQASPDFLDRDGTDPWLDTGPAKSSDTFDCGTSTQSVDQHGGIKQEPRHTQPVRWSSLCRCARTQARGSLSHSWPVSAIVPSEASMSSHLRSSSRPRRIRAAMNALRFRGPARRSKSSTRSSSSCMCILMCFTAHTTLGLRCAGQLATAWSSRVDDAQICVFGCDCQSRTCCATSMP